MHSNCSAPWKRRLITPFLAALALAAPALALAQDEIVDFDSERWVKDGSQVVTHLGQKALRGSGYIKDVVFENGVIDVDLAVDGTRCFPGVIFRMESPTEAEWFYLRPHRSGEPVALQYVPVFNGVDGWQLYTGLGATAQAEIPANRWFHVRIEVSGTQARAYLDNAAEPALVIHDLKRGVSRGSVGLVGNTTGQIHFANFKYRADDSVRFAASPPLAVRPGLITTWRISQAFPVSRINRALPPEAQTLPAIDWREVRSERSGLVNVNRWVTRTGREPYTVIARTTIASDQAQVKRLWFGYSDEVTVFLNGAPLFTGDATYRSRDPLFYGAVVLQDAVYLNLRPGTNDLVLMVTDSMGGSGFMARLEDVSGEAMLWHQGVSKEWEAARVFAVPESVLHDPKRDVFYVSSFARRAPPGQEGAGFVSRLKADGTVDQAKWISGLDRPTGMALRGDALLIVEREGLVEADARSGKILRRIGLEGAVFPNDVVVDPSGVAYVTDTDGNAIYRVEGGTAAVWLKGGEISLPNGLCLDRSRLIVGNAGDQCLKAVDLATKEVTGIVRLGPGNIDGIRLDGHGNYIVSHWEGEVYRIGPSGEMQTLLDTRAAGVNAADLEYLPEKGLLVVPAFYGGGVSAYKVAPGEGK